MKPTKEIIELSLNDAVTKFSEATKVKEEDDDE